MKTIAEFLKSTGSKQISGTVILLIFFLISSRLPAQRFWLTTYEFPFGPKTGITLTKENCLFAGIRNGVIRSCDEGQHFNLVLKSSLISSVFSTRQGKVIAGGTGKIFITDISGQNWDSIAINSGYPVIQLAENSKGDLFAITSGYNSETQIYTGDGVFVSEDKGLTWVQRNSGLGIYKGCEKIAVDKNDRLYVASADEYNSGNGGLFISDNNGILWKHIDINIDGKDAIPGRLNVGNTYGLSVSPMDSLYFSFSGVASNVSVDLSLRKSIDDIEKNNYWKQLKISNSNLWWNDKSLYSIHFAKNGDWYSSFRGTINSGATYYSKDRGDSWSKIDYGLGLNMFGVRDVQFFAETPEGKIFMVQWLDERIYWTDTSILTSTDPGQERSNELILYPNPVNRGENLTIRPQWDDAVYQMSVYDGSGKKISSAIQTTNWDYLRAPSGPGLYYLEVTGDRKREIVRFVVK